MSCVLVTGGSRGIGRAVCLEFARAGYDVAFCYSKDASGAEETAWLLGSLGAGVQAFRCDVSDEKQVEEMFESVLGLSVLVNNAGVALYRQVQDTSLGEWRRVMSVNADGAFLCTRAAVRKFLKRGSGSIVNVSSIWGEAGGACESAYSASKAALIGFTKACAKELAPSGIRVNCLSCGFIETGMNARFSEGERKEFFKNLPLARAGTAQEAAAAVRWLAESRYITGEILRLDGGAAL